MRVFSASSFSHSHQRVGVGGGVCGSFGRREFWTLFLALLSFWLGTLYTNGPPALTPPRTVSVLAGVSTHAVEGHAASRPFQPKPSARLPSVGKLQASTHRCDSTLPAGVKPSRPDIRSPDLGGPQCVFEGLYLWEGKLYYAVEGGEGAVAAAVAAFPQGYHLGHDMNVASYEAGVAPEVVSLERVAEWAGGAGVVPPPWSPLPLLVFARLNPKNIYHHLFDDQMFAYSVLCPHVKALAERGEGPGGGGEGGACAPGHVPPFALALVDSFGARDVEDWGATVAQEVHVWPLRGAGGDGKGLSRVGYTVMGTQGLCTHRRHCSNILPAPPVRLFREHLQALHGIVTALPPPGAPQTALLIRRTGRRVLTNLEELEELVRVMGFVPKVVGPLKDMTVQEQYLAFANVSLAIFVFGAELGPAWVGLPEGSCSAVLHPAGIMDTLSYWVADKVGLKVATVVENFKSGSDPRLAPRPEWAGRERGGLSFEQYSDVWLYLFNHDFRMDPKDLWRMIWCANQPWPPD